MSLLLTSPRVTLREFFLEDWPAVHAYASRPETCWFQPWGPNTPAESQAYVALAIARAGEQPRSSYILG